MLRLRFYILHLLKKKRLKFTGAQATAEKYSGHVFLSLDHPSVLPTRMS